MITISHNHIIIIIITITISSAQFSSRWYDISTFWKAFVLFALPLRLELVTDWVFTERPQRPVTQSMSHDSYSSSSWSRWCSNYLLIQIKTWFWLSFKSWMARRVDIYRLAVGGGRTASVCPAGHDEPQYGVMLSLRLIFHIFFWPQWKCLAYLSVRAVPLQFSLSVSVRLSACLPACLHSCLSVCLSHLSLCLCQI